MLKKFLVGTVVVGAAAVMATYDSPALAPYVNALQSAQSLQVDYIVSRVGGTSQKYSIQMTKPDMLRLDTPSTLIVADGKQITHFDKAQNSYYKVDQTKEALMEVFNDDNVSIFKSFFDGKALDYVASAKNEGMKQRGNKQLKVVSVNGDKDGNFTMTLYLDSQTNLLSQAEINLRNGAKSSTNILTANRVDTNAANATQFAFNVPSGAKQLSAEEMATGKWMWDFNKAMLIAKSTGKLMMVDFFATWCGPCKMMDAEVFQSAGFPARSKDFVLVKVDVDQSTDLAAKYGITAMPTVKFIDGNGKVVHEFVGYGGPDQVYGEMDKARSR